MIRIEHLNLVVSDIDESIKFYKAAFPHWQVRSKGEGDWFGKARNWLHFGDDFQYLALNDNGTGENRVLEGHQIGLAHFAFSITNLSKLIARLVSAGYKIKNNGAEDEFRRNVYFIDPSGYEVEFVEYLSDMPEERNKD